MEGPTTVTLLVLFFGFSLVAAQPLISSFTVNGQSSVSLNVGAHLEYKCSSTGPVVSWTLRGQTSGHLLMGDGLISSKTITVGHPASCADNESYQCIANSNGIQDVKTVHIQVVGCPLVVG
ncbi:unnamed protein product [Lymnaea stagnalis]|uniref:Ig-like domain-containing protein n=1 Tax=Lymnaea stagnalis TaxID=6523 RepID=A0AAV2IB72_LYMST